MKMILVLFCFISITQLFAQNSDEIISKDSLVGIWQANNSQLAAGLGDNYQFFNDNTFKYNFNTMTCGLRRLWGISGNYKIINSNIILTVIATIESVGGQIELGGAEEGEDGFVIVNDNWESIEQKEPSTLKTNITNYDPNSRSITQMSTNNYKKILISFLMFVFSFLCLAQEHKKADLFIKDSSAYSKEFLDCLKEIEQQDYSLIDSLLIINSIDTVVIPQLKIEKFEFSDKKSVLKLNQINYSTIKYLFITQGKQWEGLATIGCTFYLGSESDIDENGDSYFCDEFIDDSSNDIVGIRIGEEYCRIIIGDVYSPLLKYRSK